jgi:hypothetical protein
VDSESFGEVGGVASAVYSAAFAPLVEERDMVALFEGALKKARTDLRGEATR